MIVACLPLSFSLQILSPFLIRKVRRERISRERERERISRERERENFKREGEREFQERGREREKFVIRMNEDERESVPCI